MGPDPLDQRQPTELENSPLQQNEKFGGNSASLRFVRFYCRNIVEQVLTSISLVEVVKVKFIQYAFTNYQSWKTNTVHHPQDLRLEL